MVMDADIYQITSNNRLRALKQDNERLRRAIVELADATIQITKILETTIALLPIIRNPPSESDPERILEATRQRISEALTALEGRADER